MELPSTRDGLHRITDVIDDWVERGVVPGASLAVAVNGRLVLTHAAGKISAGAGGPVTPDTLYPVASLTKPVTAATVMRLIERGDLTLDEPIRRWVPAFARGPVASDPERRQITARELLCHVSGLPNEHPDQAALYAREASFAEIAEAAAQLPLALRPGQRVLYSNAGYWVLGAAVEAAANASFAEVMTAEVLQRGHLRDTMLTPGPEDAERIARRYGPNRIANTPYGRRLGSPTGGLFATATDMVRFASAFLPARGRARGVPFVSSASAALMTTDQTANAAIPLPASAAPAAAQPWTRGMTPLPGGIPGVQEWEECPWAFGWEVRGLKRHHWTGSLTSPGTISHLGQSGCLMWADPATGIALAVLANRDLGTGWAFGGRPPNSPSAPEAPARWARLSDLVTSVLSVNTAPALA